jgi:hypothetical protein
MQTAAPSIHEIAPGISYCSLHENQIVYFTIRTTARASWDGWYKTMLNLKSDWPADRPLLTLQDNLYKDAAFTPTVRDYSIKFTEHRPEITTYSAVILPKTLVAQFAQVFMRTIKIPNGQARVFFTVDDGLAWLKTKL